MNRLWCYRSIIVRHKYGGRAAIGFGNDPKHHAATAIAGKQTPSINNGIVIFFPIFFA
jgi:hypothetical protein